MTKEQKCTSLLEVALTYAVASVFMIGIFIAFPYLFSLENFLFTYWFAMLTSVYLFNQ